LAQSLVDQSVGLWTHDAMGATAGWVRGEKEKGKAGAYRAAGESGRGKGVGGRMAGKAALAEWGHAFIAADVALDRRMNALVLDVNRCVLPCVCARAHALSLRAGAQGQ